MAIRKIFQDGDPILLKRSREVTNFDDKLGLLLDDLRDTMRKADGAGLAAPQVGLLRRVAVVEVEDVYLELVNPQITETEGEQIGPEGCLSVDSSKNCDVARPMKVTVKAYDRHGKLYEKTVEGLAARAVCHELDHLDGILFYTRKYESK
ncbi:MAG TPA: peptide deformylase [Clostridia bacterium]|nr:peptide deformylase [Clostridia bacterium]